jgi:hypothetical protein
VALCINRATCCFDTTHRGFGAARSGWRPCTFGERQAQTDAVLHAKNISSPYMCMHRRSAAWCLTAHEMSHSAQYCALVNERSYGCFERAVCPSNQAIDFSLEAFRPSQRVFGPLVILIGQNPQPTPSGWRAVRQVRSSAESPNAQEHSGLGVLRWTAGDQQHWVLLRLFARMCNFEQSSHEYKSYHPMYEDGVAVR